MPLKKQSPHLAVRAQTVEKANFQFIFIGGHVPTMKIPLEHKIAFESPLGMRTRFFATG